MTTHWAEDKLCTSCAQRNSPGNIAETPCAAPGKARRTTPTPSTTGGPPGGDSGGGQDAGDREAPGEVRSTSPATPRTIGGPGSRFLGTGSRGDSSSEVTPPVQGSGRPRAGVGARRTRTADADAIGGPRDRVLGCGTTVQRAGDRERAGGSAHARQHGLRSARSGKPERRAGGRAAGPSISYIEGPALFLWCPVPRPIPPRDTTRARSQPPTCPHTPRQPHRDMCPGDGWPSRGHMSRSRASNLAGFARGRSRGRRADPVLWTPCRRPRTGAPRLCE